MKKWNIFSPRKHIDLQSGAGWARFVGMLVCWNWNVQWRHFNLSDVPALAKKHLLWDVPASVVSTFWLPDSGKSPGNMQVWGLVNESRKCTRSPLLILLLGDKLLQNGCARTSKSLLARDWECEKLMWAPSLTLESPSDRILGMVPPQGSFFSRDKSMVRIYPLVRRSLDD